MMSEIWEVPNQVAGRMQTRSLVLRWVPALASIFGLMIPLTGCSGSSISIDVQTPTIESVPESESTTQAKNTSSLTDEAEVTTITPAVISGESSPTSETEANSGRHIFRTYLGNHFEFDPSRLTHKDEASLQLQYEIFSTLTNIVETSDDFVEPDLAESYTISEDGRVYTFLLKHGLKFSDGSPLSSADFKWSWERALKPENLSALAKEVLGSIEGADDVMNGVSDALNGVEAINSHTLRVTLKVPRADFLMLIASPAATVLKQDNVDEWAQGNESYIVSDLSQHKPLIDQERLPVGTGPFKIERFNFDNNLTLSRNDFYHGQPAYLDGIEFIIEGIIDNDEMVDVLESNDPELLQMAMLKEDQRIVNLFENGDLDNLNINTPTGVEDIEIQKLQGYTRVPVDTIHSHFLAFNPALAPYDDLHFRRGLVAATDVPRQLKDRVERHLPLYCRQQSLDIFQKSRRSPSILP